MSYGTWEAIEPIWECFFCGASCGGYNQYCGKCGKPLWNICTNPECSNSFAHDDWIGTGEFDEDTGLGTLLPDDCFCPLCGSKSDFYEEGLISPAMTELEEEIIRAWMKLPLKNRQKFLDHFRYSLTNHKMSPTVPSAPSNENGETKEKHMKKGSHEKVKQAGTSPNSGDRGDLETSTEIKNPT